MGVVFGAFCFIFGQVYAIHYNNPISAFGWTIISLFFVPLIDVNPKDIKGEVRRE